MKRVFDIAAEVDEQVARFVDRTGNDPETCCVSEEIYRLLVEENAAKAGIGNLIIGTYAVSGIITDTAYLRLVIDESLVDCAIRVE
jgi:hypothetical protein